MPYLPPRHTHTYEPDQALPEPLAAHDNAVDKAVTAGYCLARDAGTIKQARAANAAKLFPDE
ncbi:hypothetical protein Strvi_4536 [Streptomyces violaceusniger Tu 4113]|uniref:Uncharacterized protein n=1 Tax=Streptomyces violaceusniger (strain Tu 4113) TaxID=653045 RepID=G2P4W6_STRV4|nr:hypothetical protein Strvi_4536 [Streptomyces violaceusniger Tu 4113]